MQKTRRRSPATAASRSQRYGARRNAIGVAGSGQFGTIVIEVDATITGVSGSTQSGVIAIALDRSATIAGGIVAIQADDTRAITGVATSGAAGVTAIKIDATVLGVFAPEQVGVAAPVGAHNIAITGVTAIGASGGQTFSRASTATYFDATGTLQIAAINVERFTYDPVSLTGSTRLIEASAANHLINPRFEGGSCRQ
jgi:hypothetical protein